VKRAAAAVCACCLAAGAAAAAARAVPIPLLSPNIGGPPPPPLTGGQQLSSEPGEVRVPGSLANAEAVRVGVGQDGTPVSIVVVQRMAIRGLGDFRFVVPAPATDVAPAVGSQSQPGLRQAGIVWQGFSPGRRVLGAIVRLGPAAAGAGLPLSLTITREHGFTRVRLENRTAKQFAVTMGSAPLSTLQAALARIRRGLGRQLVAGRPIALPVEQVQGTPTEQRILRFDAPLRVAGTIAIAGGGAAHVDTTLGGDDPRVRIVRLRGEGRATMRLNAAFARDRRTYLPTAAALASARDPLLALQTGLGRAAVALQYQQYLASSRPADASTTTYRYATARTVVALTPAPASGDAGTSALLIALLAVGGLAALGGLTVLWAHM
jgi:hypothetical protein